MKTLRFGGYPIPQEIVLYSLWYMSHQQGMGCLSVDALTLAEAREMFNKYDAGQDKRTMYVDYLRGRVLKVDFSDPLDLRLYVRDCGEHAVRAAEAFALDIVTHPSKSCEEEEVP